MTYLHTHCMGNLSGNEKGEHGKRVKAYARPCWICGSDAKGKFCGPCSADVQDARVHYRHKQEYQRKKNKKT